MALNDCKYMMIRKNVFDLQIVLADELSEAGESNYVTYFNGSKIDREL